MSAEISPEQIVIATDVYLGDWSHSVHSAKRATDAKATFFFPSDDDMRPLTAHQTRAGQGKRQPGKMFRLYLVEVDDDAAGEVAPDDSAPATWGHYARDLKLSGFLRSPAVWGVLGTDETFRRWVTYQRSIVSGLFSEVDDQGEQRNVACHVRRAGDAGTGYKPLYACVPMTDAEHQMQHRGGESAIYSKAMLLAGRTGRERDPLIERHAAEWFDEQRIKVVEQWAWEALRNELGVSSMKYADPDSVFDWAVGEGVERLLPACYRTSDDGQTAGDE